MRVRSPWVMLAAGCMMLGGVLAVADALDGVLQVRSAFVDLDHSVFQLHARIDYPMTPAISDALRDGVDLIFDVDARVERARRFWFDSTVVDLTLRRELAYHTVSDRYVVRDTATGDQQTFATLDAALQYLGTVDGWPILVGPQLEAGARYVISVRAGIRRGHLSSSLRALLFWTDDWSRVSDWYTWSLTT
ncbi:MAG TPA: DUF4390 domain-containing protein [Steroidobacteraceae bacterium]|nr:DUF4390 domain-containing protein [Steroidobacteraceae bacterium]